MPDSPPAYRLVTPWQYKQGYLELNGMVAERKPFTLVRRDPDGNYVVLDPEWERWEREIKSGKPEETREGSLSALTKRDEEGVQ